MMKAAKNACIERGSSYSSISSVCDRFRPFSNWLKDRGIKDLRFIEKQHVQAYAQSIAERVSEGTLAVSSAHNYLSAVNTVMQQARADRAVYISPSDYIENRSQIAKVNRVETPENQQKAFEMLEILHHGPRISVMIKLQNELGLRFRESALINAQKALQQAETNNVVSITDGTKGGRHRFVPITDKSQIQTLREAAELQAKHRSLVPPDQSYKAFRKLTYNLNSRLPINGFHSFRAAYAQRLYQALTGAPCPLVAGIPHRQHFQFLAGQLGISRSEARRIDRQARAKVANALGHGKPNGNGNPRIDVTNSYLG